MADFDDSADPELGGACNRLAVWVESLPESVVIDAASELTERDLALILRRLYSIRRDSHVDTAAAAEGAQRHSRASVPITAKS